MDDIQAILSAMVREAVSPQTAAVAIAVIGLNIHFGYTGLLNIGQSAFMLLGAYGFAITISQGYPMALGIVMGLLLALVFALVLGVPTLKLRGDYLAIVTISAAEIIRYLGRSVAFPKLLNLTGGAQGIPGSKYQTPFVNIGQALFGSDGSTTILGLNVRGSSTPVKLLSWLVVLAVAVALIQVARGKTSLAGSTRRWTLIGLGLALTVGMFVIAPVSQQNVGNNGWWFTLVAWLLVLGSALLVTGLTRSPWGRLLRGVREDEDAMRSLGKNVFAVKMQALVIGGLFGAVGGMMYVLPGTVQPDSMGRSLTFFCYTALLLGGAATIWGPVLGSLIFYVGRIFLISFAQTYLTDVPLLNMTTQRSTQFAYIVVGVALMLLVIFRPQGILGDKRELRFNV